MDDIERLRFEYDGIAYKMLSDSEVEVSRNLKIKFPDVAILNSVYGCEHLESLFIPDSVREVEDYDFD